MNKAYVDKIITEYIEKIFGFALSKTMDTNKAEELASRITYNVYVSLMKNDDVHNINGYIYRVARNVYARFVDEEVRGKYISLDEVGIASEDDFTDDFEKNETYIRLRHEISYLGKTQREIVVMHYFQKLKLNEIAKRLNIPLGTVKWHLHDARSNIKEGIKYMRGKGTLGMKPIKFTSMGHSGNPGPDGKDTAFYFSKLISQNVAYAAYHEAKTIVEIADELGVPAAFIEDEIVYLEDNGFIDKVAGGKYLTNILIYEPSIETMEQEHKLYTKYAKIVRDKYIPLVFETIADYKTESIYSPENDINFLMWSAVTYACGKKLRVPGEKIDISKYRVKHKDGGDYIAHVQINDDIDWASLSYNPELYNTCGDMTRCGGSKEPYPVYAWQLDTYYDDRKGAWQDNIYTDYYYLYEFMTGKIAKDPSHADKFKRLFDKGYIVTKGDSEYVNMIVTTLSEKDFSNILPSIPEELKTVSKELDTELYKIRKTQYPPHMQDLCKARSMNCLSDNTIRTLVLEMLFADGTLKPLTENQKHSVNTIIFCDILPKKM